VAALAVCASAGLLAPVAAAAPAPAVLVEDKPPQVVGATFAAARDLLVAWWPTVSIDVEPAGFPTGADPALLTVDTEVLRNPGWSDGSVTKLPDPIVAVSLSTEVPQLAGLPLEAATKVLTTHGLGALASPPEAAGDWFVVIQKPEPGLRVRLLRRLSIVSLGLEPSVLVPDVGGLTEDRARSAVEDAGLVYALDLARNGLTPGTVIGQDPMAGTAVRRGTGVTVRVERAAVPGPTGNPDPLQNVAWRTAGLGVLSALLLLLLVLVGLLVSRAMRGQGPRGEVRTEVHTPPPDIRIEQLTDGPVWRISLEPRGDPGTQLLEEIGT
jgi:hypothetical protein